MSEQGRNAAAGERQKQHQKQEQQATGRAFQEYGLTRKNEEFMFQLNKQLDAQGATAEKKSALIQQTMDALLEGQKTAKTAKGMFGTPTAYAHELLHPKKEVEAKQENTNIWMLAADNALMFFAIFTIMFGVLAFTSPKALAPGGHNGNAGLTAIIIVALAGGALFGCLMKLIRPKVDANGRLVKRSLWYRTAVIILGLVTWIAVYGLTALMPNVINPVLNKWVYVILGLAGFAGDLYLRSKFNITNALFGSQRRRN
ncbi:MULTISPECIES: DUF1129 domain-containing protein [Lactobacillaceae]|uniref:DUF1129 domain-containing protein n=1 Tax=Limosilactobacillus alvi TaxID=990412 RepID=A0ABS2ELR8_9LACO|nr:DUF1129 domain-containing protein [Lactobacillus sp. 3B(2020)]MBM6753176.1 DUF1129 domain-containing protein [Limosilactobacillus alvi]QLL70808.1 DUF1129 family protein [Lactobacillus sp. 3B(2020)]